MEVTRNGALGASVVQVVELVNILERAPALILPQGPAGRTAQAWVQTKILSSAATTIAQVNKFEIINKEWMVPQSWSWRIFFHWIPSQKDKKPHTTGLHDTAILHTKIKITDISLERKLNTAIP